MSNICIISEFNPFHNGHEYLISKAREMGAKTVTCIMSGNAVQRGELAITDKYVRAEAAVRCGADLVIELPYPWCCASADYFATAAVSIARHFGDMLLFGSECGDVDYLTGAATICESEAFKADYCQRTASGTGAATAYMEILSQNGFMDFSSNDLLGIAYIRAIKKLNADIVPITVQRLGGAYNSEKTVDGEFQSATALRMLLKDADEALLEKYMPLAMAEALIKEGKEGRITEMCEVESAVIGFFRLCRSDTLINICDAGGGLANRICTAAHSSISFNEMFENIRTKRYTDAKLRRAILFCMTGVLSEDVVLLPEYTTLLAANTNGRELLSVNKKSGGISVVTKPADAPENTRQYILSQKLDALYGLARKQKMSSDTFFKKCAYIQK